MRILVATASRHGSTTRIGRAIAAVLESGGHQVVTTSISADGDPTGGNDIGDVDVAVVGAPIYLGAWMENAEQALFALLDSGIRTYDFAVGVHDLADTPTARRLARAVGSDDVGPRVVFGGAVRRDLLSENELTLLALDDHEYTDPAVVRAWAEAVAQDLALVVAT